MSEVVHQFETPETGASWSSSVTYDHPNMRAALERMFNLRANERITQVTFNETGATAQIKRTNDYV